MKILFSLISLWRTLKQDLWLGVGNTNSFLPEASFFSLNILNFLDVNDGSEEGKLELSYLLPLFSTVESEFCCCG